MNRVSITVVAVLVLSAAFSDAFFQTPPKRAKRVVPGYDLTYRDAYAAIKYYVWISRIPDCIHFHVLHYTFPRITMFDFGLIPCVPSPTDLMCGGSLITPTVVATACHCMADFTYRGDRFQRAHPKDMVLWEPHFFPAVLRNHYLNPMELWAGRSYVAQFAEIFTKSKGYYAHPRCASLTDSPLVKTFDFGWVVLHNSIADDQAQFDITYAPLYREIQLKDFRYEVQSKEMVCLLMGFGRTAYSATDSKYGNVSNVLRYGWVVTMDHLSCFWYTSSFWEPQVKGKYNHTEICSWACQRSFGMRAGHYGFGDSGSPITCNDAYFAQVSAGGLKRFEKYRDDFGIHMPPSFYMYSEMISSTPFHYAYEYRRSFIKMLQDYEIQMDYNRRHAIQFADLIPPTLPVDIRYSTVRYAATEKALITSNSPSLQQSFCLWLHVAVSYLVAVHNFFMLKIS